MALNTFKCNCPTSLGFKGLSQPSWLFDALQYSYSTVIHTYFTYLLFGNGWPYHLRTWW